MKNKVVIIGRGYSGRLSIIRSLAEIDCEITVISLIPNMHVSEKTKLNEFTLDAYSKYVNRVFYSESYNTEMLINILMKECVDYAQKTFIFPDNDFSASVVDEYRDQLKEHFYIPHVKDSAGAVREWMDKVKQKTLASKIGLNVAKSVLIEVRDKQFSIPDSVEYPCFAKPLRSIVGGKPALKRCDSKADLQRHISYISTLRPDVDILVEDYKIIDKEYATLGFSDGETVVIPGVLELLKVAHGSHFGVAMQGRVFPADGNTGLIEKFKEYVKEMGFVGIFDIDFYESQGVMYFCEMNLRFGGSGYAFTATGVNLPVMMIRSFLGEDITNMKKTIDKEAVYFNERMAFDDWYAGYLTMREYKNMRDGSDIRFVANGEDEKPYEMLKKEAKIKSIKRTIKKFCDKK